VKNWYTASDFRQVCQFRTFRFVPRTFGQRLTTPHLGSRLLVGTAACSEKDFISETCDQHFEMMRVSAARMCSISMTVLLLRLTSLTAARGSMSWSLWRRFHEERDSTEHVSHNFVNDLATQRRWFLDPSLSTVSVLLLSAVFVNFSNILTKLRRLV